MDQNKDRQMYTSDIQGSVEIILCQYSVKQLVVISLSLRRFIFISVHCILSGDFTFVLYILLYSIKIYM